MKIKSYKRSALKKLSDYWAEAVIITTVNTSIFVIYVLTGYLAYQLLQNAGLVDGSFLHVAFGLNKYYLGIAVIRLVALFFFVSPAIMGKCWCYMQAGKGNEAPVNCLFSCYSSRAMYAKCLRISLLVLLESALVLVPFTALAIFEINVTKKIILTEQMNFTNVMFVTGCVVVIVLLALIYIAYSIRFIAVPNLFVSNPYGKARDIVKNSEQLVKGHRKEILKLVLSFFWVMLLCALIFPIMVVIPYYNMTVINAVEEIINSKEKSVVNEGEKAVVPTM